MVSEGKPGSGEELFHHVYAELKRLACSVYRRSPRRDPSLHPTVLVNEVYLRLVGGGPVTWESRVHFFNMAARCMRRVLVDAARARLAQKRGGRDMERIPLDEMEPSRPSNPELLVALDEALQALSALDSRCAEVVSLRYFLGLSRQETSELLNVSEKTVQRDWDFARVWLETRLRLY